MSAIKSCVKVKKIIHIDMDCFFAAVEMRDNPQYQGLPLAVGGASSRRGVISTCNYEARKYGVHSAMSTSRALRLCPHLILLPGRMSIYKEVSQQIVQIFRRYTPLVEPVSIDEAYLDVTDESHFGGSATWMAQAIKNDIASELNLTASAGVASVKFLAKIASDMHKPDGLTVIPPDQMQQMIDTLPLDKISGVGKVTVIKLHQLGYFNCLDIKNANYRELLSQFGLLGQRLWQLSHGIDERQVRLNREKKSLSIEKTLAQNLHSFTQCQQMIKTLLLPELKRRFEQLSVQRDIVKLGVKVKFADFQTTTVEHGHDRIDMAFFSQLLVESLKRQKGREIRLIGLTLVFKPLAHSTQLTLF